MRKAAFSLLMMSAIGLLTACGGGEETDVVESGTHEGTVAKVKPDEKEIYVDHGEQKLELYFTDSTQLMQNGESVKFGQLEKGQKVMVKVEKMGKKLNPLEVEILE